MLYEVITNSLGYNYTVIEHAESTRTALEAAERAGCELGQIVKSLIFKGKESGKPIIVLTSGANRVDEKRIRGYAGEDIGKAYADFVRAVTGFAIGGVPPVGVITSYSIHYTKLYDSRRSATVSSPWAARRAATARST